MQHAFYLALCYLRFHRLKALILIACITLTLYFPAAINSLVRRFQTELLARGEATPLVIGARGSRFDLVLHALHFQTTASGTLAWREVDRVRETGLAMPIPLLIRYRARGVPIVGTTLDYFEFRGLNATQGELPGRLGDCVLGARAAARLGLRPGDGLTSDPENLYDLAGSYPLKMRVVGVLAPAYSPDDDVVFVDIKTAWIIAGLGHGHQELSQADEPNLVLRRDPQQVVASAAVVQFVEITDENIDRFHFHGDSADFPLTAIIAVSVDVKSGTILQGRYQGDTATAQILVPREEVRELMQMVFRIKRFLDVGAVFAGVVTGLLVALVMLLSLRLRAGEMTTMFKLGCSRMTIVRLQAAELLLVVGSSFLLACLGAAATRELAPQLLRQWFF